MYGTFYSGDTDLKKTAIAMAAVAAAATPKSGKNPAPAEDPRRKAYIDG